MRGVHRVLHREQSTHATSSLHRSAQVHSPEIRADGVVVRPVQLRHQVPAVIDELVGDDGRIRRVRPRFHLLADAPTHEVVGEGQAVAGTGRRIGQAFHRDQAVFPIPTVGPAAVTGLVAIGVVGEGFRGLGDEDLAGDGVGVAAQNGGVGDEGIEGGGGVGVGGGGLKIFAFAGGALAVHRHGGGGVGNAKHIHGAGDVAANERAGFHGGMI